MGYRVKIAVHIPQASTTPQLERNRSRKIWSDISRTRMGNQRACKAARPRRHPARARQSSTPSHRQLYLQFTSSSWVRRALDHLCAP